MGNITRQSKIILGILIFIFVLVIGGVSLKWILATDVIAAGAPADKHPISLPTWLETPTSIVFGDDSLNSTESFILVLAVFLILLVALADIINAFSSFSEPVSWVIALGLAIIGSVTRVVENIVAWFGVTASIGAIGIGLIVIWAIVIAVVMNFVVGWSGLKAVHRAQQDQEEVNKATSDMRKGFGLLSGASDIVEGAAKK